MDIALLRALLGWNFIFNYAVLILWALFFIFARGWMYSLHSRWFSLTRERFDEIHYLSMAIYKIVLFVFVLFPYLALLVIS